MRKIFVVIKTKAIDDMATTHVVAAFETEADAMDCAQKWTDDTTHAWVDEVNLYE